MWLENYYTKAFSSGVAIGPVIKTIAFAVRGKKVEIGHHHHRVRTEHQIATTDKGLSGC